MSSQEPSRTSEAVDHIIQSFRYSPSKPRYSLSICNINHPLMYDLLNQSCVRLGIKIVWGKRDSTGHISGGIVTTDRNIYFCTDLVQSSRFVKLLNMTFYSENPSHLDVIRQIYNTFQSSSLSCTPIVDTSSNTIWNPSPAPASLDPNIQPYLHISNTSKHECPECHSSLISKTRTYFSKSGDILFWDACCSSGHYIVIENK